MIGNCVAVLPCVHHAGQLAMVHRGVTRGHQRWAQLDYKFGNSLYMERRCKLQLGKEMSLIIVATAPWQNDRACLYGIPGLNTGIALGLERL